MTQHTLQPDFSLWMRRAVVIAVAVGVVSIIGALLDPQKAAQGYALGFIFWMGVSFGALFLLLLHHLTGGAWGFALRPALESAAEVLVLGAVLFVGLLFMLGELYEWAGAHGEHAEAHHPLPAAREAYLTVPGFILRGVVYWAVWLAFLWFIVKRSPEVSADPARGDMSEQRRVGLAAAGVIALALTGTFAFIDWYMALDSHWFSAGFGVYAMAGFAFSAYVLCVATTARMIRPSGAAVVAAPRTGEIRAERIAARTEVRPLTVRDLGNLMLVFVMVWAYLAFSQYLIIWAGYIQEDIGWYVRRREGIWPVVAVAIILLHFAIPFAALLSGTLKQSLAALTTVAIWLFVMRFVETLWSVVPSFPDGPMDIHWLHIAIPAAIGGVWMILFCLRMQSRAGPRVVETLTMQEKRKP